jgi:hypothetical protein
MNKNHNNLSTDEKLNHKTLKIVSATTLATFLVASSLAPLAASGEGGDEEMERALSGSPKIKASQGKMKAKAGSSLVEPKPQIQFHSIQVPSLESLSMLYAGSQEEERPGQTEIVTDLIKATTKANSNALKARMLAATLGSVSQ